MQTNSSNPTLSASQTVASAVQHQGPTSNTEPLVDWRAVQPDGTPESVQALATHLSRKLGGEVVVGLRFDGASIEIHRSISQRSVQGPESAETTPDQLLTSAALEASYSPTSCYYAAEQGSTSGVLQNLRESTDSTLVLSFGLPPTTHGRQCNIGIVIKIGRSHQLRTMEFYSTCIQQLQSELPNWGSVWGHCNLGLKAAAWTTGLTSLRSRKASTTLLVVMVLTLVLAIPVPYRPQRQCVVEPAARAYLSSPIDGNMANAMVRPGDSVVAGQLLARIDDEQIRWDLSAAMAEFEAAGKRRDTALATRASGEMRLAGLEQERIALKISSLEKQLQQLELRSSMDGVIVRGDWFQSVGAPIKRGDTLFEIAPLDEMQIETHLRTEDLGFVVLGTNATAHFGSASSESWMGELKRIDPRGQVIDSKIVFVADMQVSNRDKLLRPGMKGTVRISAGMKSIGWLLFHHPYTWVMKKLVW